MIPIVKAADGVLDANKYVPPIFNQAKSRNTEDKRELSDVRKQQWDEYNEKSRMALLEAKFDKALTRAKQRPTSIHNLEVERWFTEMKDKASIEVWHKMFKFYIDQRRTNVLYPLLEEMRLVIAPTSLTYWTVIAAFAHEGDVDTIWKLSTDMEKEKVTPWSRTCVTIMQAYAKFQSPSLALRYFDSLKNKMVRSLPLYHAALELIKQCHGTFDTALGLVQQMESEAPVAVSPDALVYRLLLQCFDKHAARTIEELWDKLDKLVAALKGYVAVNETFLQAALELSVLQRGDSAQNLLQTFTRMQKSVPLGDASYNTLVTLLSRGHHLPLAIEVIRKMRTGDVKLSVAAEAVLVSEFVASNNYALEGEDALGFIKRLLAVKHPLSHLSLHTLLSWVKPTALEAFFLELQESHKFKPTVEDYNVMLTTFAKIGDFGRCSRFMSELTQGLRPDIQSYNALLLCFWNTKQYIAALRMLRVLDHTKCKPNAETLCRIIDCCGMSFQMKFGQNVFDEHTKKYGIELTTDLWTSLIVGWCRSGKFHTAVAQFARFRDPSNGMQGEVPVSLALAVLEVLQQPNDKAVLEQNVLQAIHEAHHGLKSKANLSLSASELSAFEQVLLLVSPLQKSPVIAEAKAARRRAREERSKLRKEQALEVAEQKELDAEANKPVVGSWQAMLDSDPALKRIAENEDEKKEKKKSARREARKIRQEKLQALRQAGLDSPMEAHHPAVESSKPHPEIGDLLHLLDSSKFEKPKKQGMASS